MINDYINAWYKLSTNLHISHQEYYSANKEISKILIDKYEKIINLLVETLESMGIYVIFDAQNIDELIVSLKEFGISRNFEKDQAKEIDSALKTHEHLVLYGNYP